jgi:hypothetical protein
VGDQASRVITLAVLCLIAQRALLREPLHARLADVAAPTAILGVWLLAWLLPRRSERPAGWSVDRQARPPTWGHLGRVLLASVLLILTVSSVALVGRFGSTLHSVGIFNASRGVVDSFRNTVSRLRTSPPIEASDGISRARRSLASYVHDCTAPTDRLLVTWFAPEFYYYSERGFAGGQLFWFDRYHDSPADQARTLQILRGQSVPVIIDRTERTHSLRAFERVEAYVRENYYLAAEGSFGDRDVTYRVLVHNQAIPVGTDRQLPLPCFRS